MQYNYLFSNLMTCEEQYLYHVIDVEIDTEVKCLTESHPTRI